MHRCGADHRGQGLGGARDDDFFRLVCFDVFADVLRVDESTDEKQIRRTLEELAREVCTTRVAGTIKPRRSQAQAA